MRNTNRKRALLISCSVILLCLSVITGMTWALFSDTKDMNHHLKAGKLEITLLRKNLSGNALNPKTGELVPLEELFDNPKYLSQEKVFTNSSDNVFELTDTTKVVPGSSYVADMQIVNRSDVAFVYWVEILYEKDKDQDDFAKQVEVKVDTTIGEDGGETRAILHEGLYAGSETQPLGKLLKGQSATFSVSVVFETRTHEENNQAQAKEVDFDLVVHAVQVNPATSQ